MKNTLRRRTFISAIAMLVVSAIVLTSSTFAWFSMAKRVEVDSMELNITSPDGIQISANTSAWTTTLTREDFVPTADTTTRWKAYTGHLNNFPELLIPSSTRAFNTAGTGALAGNLPIFYSGSIADDGRLTAEQVTSDQGSGYVAFDLFVKTSTAQQVFWGETTVTCADNAEVETAMRVMLVNCGTVAEKTTDAATIQSALPENTRENRVVMYEIDSQNHTAASGATGAVTTDYIFRPVTSRPAVGDNSNILTDTAYVGATGATVVNETNAVTNAYFNAQAGVNRIRVYMWMEGNDVDCANDVAGATIAFNLVLTIA